jgi:hypothetical protein
LSKFEWRVNILGCVSTINHLTPRDYTTSWDEKIQDARALRAWRVAVVHAADRRAE